MAQPTASLPVEGLIINLLWAQLWAPLGVWMPRSSLWPCCPPSLPLPPPPQSQNHHTGVREGSPGRQGRHLHPWLCLVAPTLQPRSGELVRSSLQSPAPRSPLGGARWGCGSVSGSQRGELDWEEDRGELGLSGGLFAPNGFRRATQFPLEPLTPQLFLESRERGRGSSAPQS